MQTREKDENDLKALQNFMRSTLENLETYYKKHLRLSRDDLDLSESLSRRFNRFINYELKPGQTFDDAVKTFHTHVVVKGIEKFSSKELQPQPNSELKDFVLNLFTGIKETMVPYMKPVEAKQDVLEARPAAPQQFRSPQLTSPASQQASPSSTGYFGTMPSASKEKKKIDISDPSAGRTKSSSAAAQTQNTSDVTFKAKIIEQDIINNSNTINAIREIARGKGGAVSGSKNKKIENLETFLKRLREKGWQCQSEDEAFPDLISFFKLHPEEFSEFLLLAYHAENANTNGNFITLLLAEDNELATAYGKRVIDDLFSDTSDKSNITKVWGALDSKLLNNPQVVQAMSSALIDLYVSAIPKEAFLNKIVGNRVLIGALYECKSSPQVVNTIDPSWMDLIKILHEFIKYKGLNSCYAEYANCKQCLNATDAEIQRLVKPLTEKIDMFFNGFGRYWKGLSRLLGVLSQDSLKIFLENPENQRNIKIILNFPESQTIEESVEEKIKNLEELNTLSLQFKGRSSGIKLNQISHAEAAKEFKEFNLAEYPSVKKPIDNNSMLVIGDMHGNAVKLLYLLVLHGLVNMDEKDYKEFLRVYSVDARFYTPELMDQLNAVMEKIEINKDSACHVRLIGDLLADRGNNDLFTLKLLEKLHDAKSISMEIMMSNHDMEFFNAIKNVNARIYHPRLGTEQDKSYEKLHTLVQLGLVSADDVKKIVDRAYMPYLTLISYNVYVDDQGNKTIDIYSHAGIGFDTLKALADAFSLPFNDSSVEDLAESIDQINQYVKNNFKSLADAAASITKDIKTLKDRLEQPFYSVFWNRSYDDQLDRPSQRNAYQIRFRHGHDASESPRPSNVICYDNHWGKEANSNLADQEEAGFAVLQKDMLFLTKERLAQLDALIEELQVYLRYLPEQDSSAGGDIKKNVTLNILSKLEALKEHNNQHSLTPDFLGACMNDIQTQAAPLKVRRGHYPDIIHKILEWLSDVTGNRIGKVRGRDIATNIEKSSFFKKTPQLDKQDTKAEPGDKPTQGHS